MKKRTTKIAAALFAATLAVTGTGLANITAQAASITITNKEEGHSYNAYQLFVGDVSGNKLSNVKKGANLNLTSEFVEEFNNLLKLTEEKAVVFKANDLDGTAQDIVSALAVSNITTEEKTTVVADAEALANLFSRYTTGNATKVAYDKTKQNYKASDLSDGYYIVKEEYEKGSSLEGNKAYSEYLLQVAGDAEVIAKSAIPTVEKKVAKVTKGTVGSDWADAADYAIGDTIAYKFTGTLASNYDNYNVYYYQFADTFDQGLDFTGNVKVYVDNTTSENEITDYVINPKTAEDGKHYANMTVTFEDLKSAHYANIEDDASTPDVDESLANITASSKIIVTYTAKLNANAYLNDTKAKGNWNKVKLVYSNNPTATGDGQNNPKGETPEDQVTVFTYNVDAVKVGSDDVKTPLGSEKYGHAVFSVKNSNGDLIGYGQTDEEGKVTFYTDDSVNLAADGKSLTGIESGVVLTVPQGTYTVSELNAPNGYKAVSEFTFEVKATYDETVKEPVIKELKVFLSEGASATVDDTTVTIIDIPESDLPVTGDSGRALYYAFGGMVAIAALLYLLREKKNA